ncbi:aconitate hydratase [Polychytrium aggregatum]|uniref:aconitate hydratase n=1 Tax=Polychytrium aggregatum TaxID=110093 RepID=UPI0022FE728D|nr:aconitate hydratase [Polychytrium aggregatum]KAI9207020.1 aconitate hydratase [Polychytrium aggregatum]
MSCAFLTLASRRHVPALHKASLAQRAFASHARNGIPPYQRLVDNLAVVRQSVGDRPLTLAEKILYSHLSEAKGCNPIRGETYLKLNPDASAQTAVLQFMLSGRKSTAVPSSIHCDHLIEAYEGGDRDVARSLESSGEIFNFLQSAAEKFGISFWKPGSGIIHQIVLENYAAPGTLMLGTDSHTPNAGGLGMLAIGVGGADAVDAMAGIPWELKAPKIIGVHLTGKLSGWTSPKDVILRLAGLLTVQLVHGQLIIIPIADGENRQSYAMQGGTNHILEYFGPGADSLSCTGMATICNMGAEVGATTSVFPYSVSMGRYLRATHRSDIAEAVDNVASLGFLRADKNAHYDQVIEINLSELEPHINGPFTPDAATPISQFANLVKKNGWKDEVKVCLIGSCTNSSYEDMSRAASIAHQAADKGLKTKTGFFITPGSEQIRATVERDGQTDALSSVGGKVLANACGPCIGQWKRTDIDQNQENAILTSFNRNFKSRNDGFSKTMNFLASPDIVTAMAFSGKLSFNPVTDTLLDAQGNAFKFEPPKGSDLPSEGFIKGRESLQVTTVQKDTTITIDPQSSRLQILDPFAQWDGQEFADLKVLVKVQGKCTTDHISAAGKWLKYKGHLENIANNTLIGATNAFNGKVNVVTNELDGSASTPDTNDSMEPCLDLHPPSVSNIDSEGAIPEVARAYKSAGVPWVVVADSNYGEGSAREHAAMQPRYLGCKMIISRSFARIHETNLKKQGVLPVTFANPADYDLITEGCTVETVGLRTIAPGSPLKIRVTPKNGTAFHLDVKHTLSEDQIEWFKAGSALNMIASSQN